ncbi:Phytochrome-like protein cph1 [Luteitalea pratensis]|uniref:histidine kinase n=1 Tax=Luteitalea pratensis TaxID=1855912 RepID=A0A143PT61_LUTPR|nr:Phytochrome-like protein cph1 [Luteitalea pratensis]
MTLTPPTQSNVAPGDPRAGSLSQAATQPSVAPAAEQAFETFSYAISHDLRAPLRAIEGYAQAIVEDFGGQLPPGALEFVSRIRLATQTVEQRVDALLRLSRLSRGALRTGRCDLAETATQLLDDLRQVEPGRQVATSVAASIPVFGDATLLAIAFENLLSNAWKFTRGRPAPRIEVDTAIAGEDIVVIVRDNGVGFDMRQAHRLGVPFQRLHTGESFEGLGIGLSSARRIIERHGGRLWAESNPGQGATFYVSLPTVQTR